jgi:hypothetical protein
MTWEIFIPLIALGLSFLSIILELFMHDREKGKKIEFAIKRKQREVKRLQKEKKTDEMMKTQKELMSLMGKNFKLRMRVMFISFPLFIVILFLLNGALNVAPLEAGEVNEVGLKIKNLDATTRNLNLSFESSDIQTEGASVQMVELDDKGDQGDTEELWWNVTAPEGEHEYSILINNDKVSDNIDYTVNFVPQGALTADFSPDETQKLENSSVEATPLYKGVEIKLFGINLSWYIYYIISYFAVTIIISPLKNKILWGHPKGIKHLEKEDSKRKAEEAENKEKEKSQ